MSTKPDDSFDLNHFRLSSDFAILPKSKPHRSRRPFLRGPIPLNWLATAGCLSGQALHVGIVIWYLSGLKNSKTVDLSQVPLGKFGVTRRAGYRGLKALERAGLVKAERRNGRKTRVTILEVQPNDSKLVV